MNAEKQILSTETWTHILDAEKGSIMPQSDPRIKLRVGANDEAKEIYLPTEGIRFGLPASVWARGAKVNFGEGYGNSVIEVIKW